MRDHQMMPNGTADLDDRLQSRSCNWLGLVASDDDRKAKSICAQISTIRIGIHIDIRLRIGCISVILALRLAAGHALGATFLALGLLVGVSAKVAVLLGDALLLLVVRVGEVLAHLGDAVHDALLLFVLGHFKASAAVASARAASASTTTSAATASASATSALATALAKAQGPRSLLMLMFVFDRSGVDDGRGEEGREDDLDELHVWFML